MTQNKWRPPNNPPPPMFLGEKERDLVKQVNDEIIERVIGQTVLYFPISLTHTQFHPIYGEAIEKNFLPPVRVHALVKFEGIETATDAFGLDKKTKITVNFHRRRLTQDQNLFVREGDFIFYGGRFFEIVTANIPRQLFGQAEHRFEITANCISARRGLFEHPAEIDEVIEKFRELTEDGTPVNMSNVVEGCRGRIIKISAADNSSQLPQFIDYVENPQNYKGCIIYLTALGSYHPAPFNLANKFYYNEDGTWYTSPFIFEIFEDGPFDWGTEEEL